MTHSSSTQCSSRPKVKRSSVEEFGHPRRSVEEATAPGEDREDAPRTHHRRAVFLCPFRPQLQLHPGRLEFCGDGVRLLGQRIHHFPRSSEGREVDLHFIDGVGPQAGEHAGAGRGFGVTELSEDVLQWAPLALPSIARASEDDVSLFLGQIIRL